MKYRRWLPLLLPVMWLAVLGSAVQVIYARHKARDMFVNLEKLNAERDSLDMEWGRLQLEQSYWSSHAFVERVANAKLQMNLPQNPRCADRAAVKMRSGDNDAQAKSYRWRSILVLSLVFAGAAGLVARAVELQLVDHGFLAKQGEDRSMRVVKIAAHRGAITDRNGEPLAVSTPVDSVWVNPQEINDNIDQLPKLAKALKEDQQTLARRITSNLDREFLYLERHMPPEQAAHVKALGIPGVYLLREYRRYYPAGEVSGHVVGFTTIDDKGQEGLELGFDQLLNGEDGAKRVIQDLYGRYVENIESIRSPSPGRDPRDQHRPAHPVSGLPRTEGGDAGVPRACRLRHRRRCRHRRGARHGEPALVQPQRPRAAQARPVPQSRGHRYFRAGFQRQALHHGRGSGLGTVSSRQRGGHFPGILESGEQGRGG